MMLRPDVWNRSVKLAVAITVLLVFVLWFRPPQHGDGRRLKSWFSQSGHPQGSHHDDNEISAPLPIHCVESPDADNIVITVKTGASEAAARIPTQMRTTLQCPPNVLHYSDMAQKVGNITIHDALAPIAEFVKIGNPDFDLYRQQIARKKLGWHDEVPSEDTKQAAWTLDKYKNLHIVADSYRLMPKKKWYLHIDADTYVFWPSLLWWLGRLDDTKPLYTGSLTCFGDVKAAHGGSGIVLSESAMRAIVDNSSTIPSWDGQAQQHCCGDELVARALKDNEIEMHNSWPIINGDSPVTVPYGPQFWCEPIVTMHHLSTHDMEMVAKFEAQRQNRDVPVTYLEIFRDMVFDMIPDTAVDDWDNSAEGITLPDIPSFGRCAVECEQNESCFQVVYDGTDCVLGTRNFRPGQERKPEDGKKWQSQWFKGRIRDWAASHTDCSNLSIAFKDAFICG